jgi:hypothetical protein
MKSKLLIVFSIFIMIFGTSCSKTSDNKLLHEKGKSQTTVLQLLQQIDSLNALGAFNAQVAKDFITTARTFSTEYPEDQMSAEFLYKAALMAMTVAKVSQNTEEKELYCQTALTIFDDIQKVYPEFSGIKNCIINKGVIYDDILHDYDNAEMYYRIYIAAYPTDTMAINLESYLRYLGKSPDEIMAEFSGK